MKALELNTPYKTFLKEVESYPLLSREEEHELAVKYYEKNDLNAVNRLVLSNLRFVIKVAGEYKSYGFPLMDLIQEGTIGLMYAVKKFNPYKGYKLISYAVWSIRARIHDHIMKSWSAVKIGTTQAQRKLFQKISNAKRKLKIYSDTLSEGDTSKLAGHFGVKEKDVVEMELRYKSRDFSLNQNSEEDSSKNYIEILEDENPNQELLVSEIEFRSLAQEGIERGMQKLNDRERKIINERFLSENPKKLHMLGSELGISRERVRQIEGVALRKLKRSIKTIAN